MGIKILERGTQPEEKNVKTVEYCVMINCMILFAVQKYSGAVVVRRPEQAENGARMREKSHECTGVFGKPLRKFQRGRTRYRCENTWLCFHFGLEP